jgi:hypothetical protein
MSAARQYSDLPLFAMPPHRVRGMARVPDRTTSIDAAERIHDRVSELQQRVLEAFRTHGNMTAEQCEDLPEFAELGPSTVRKRISELTKRNPPMLVERGVTRNSRGAKMTRWGLP